MGKYNQFLENVGYGIAKEDALGVIVYYKQRNWKEDNGESMEVKSDLTSATYYPKNKQKIEIFGEVEVLVAIKKFECEEPFEGKIEEYLNKNCFRWFKRREEIHNNTRYVTVKEFGPMGQSQGLYTLAEKEGKIYDQFGDLIKEEEQD